MTRAARRDAGIIRNGAFVSRVRESANYEESRVQKDGQSNQGWQRRWWSSAMNPPVIALMLAIALAAPVALAQDKAADVTDMQALRAAVKADKRAFVASTLDLAGREATRFWPIYGTYQRDLEVTSRRRVVALEGLLFRDTAMTNLAAKNLVAELAAVDEAEVKARRTLRNRLMRVLPPIKVARYLQLEDKIQAVRDYDIASTVPLLR
jgi:hypothetical protein